MIKECKNCQLFDRKYQHCTSGQQIADYAGEYDVSPGFICNIPFEFIYEKTDPLTSAIDRITSWELENPVMGDDATIDLEEIPIEEAKIILAALTAYHKPIDCYPNAGKDKDADDWGNGYSRGYADGIQHHKPIADADVQRAIDELYLYMQSGFDRKKEPHQKTIFVAIDTMERYSALEQTQPIEPCEFCDGNLRVVARGGITSLWIEGNHFGVKAKNESNYATINYCPNCGKRLESEENI